MPRPKKAPGTKQDARNESAVVLITPKDDLKPPDPPQGLGSRARAVWRNFWKSDVAQAIDWQSDRFALLRWITDVNEYDIAVKLFRENRFVTGSKNQVRLNPIASYINELSTRISAVEERFGMTPSARLKLGIAYGQAQLTAAELNRQVRQASLEAANESTDDEFDEYEDAAEA